MTIRTTIRKNDCISQSPVSIKDLCFMLGLWHTTSSTKKWVIAISKQQKMLESSQKQTFDRRNVILLVNGVKLAVSMAERLSPLTWKNIWLQIKSTQHNCL